VGWVGVDLDKPCKGVSDQVRLQSSIRVCQEALSAGGVIRGGTETPQAPRNAPLAVVEEHVKDVLFIGFQDAPADEAQKLGPIQCPVAVGVVAVDDAVEPLCKS
jgi:hypothetical protein